MVRKWPFQPSGSVILENRNAILHQWSFEISWGARVFSFHAIMSDAPRPDARPQSVISVLRVMHSVMSMSVIRVRQRLSRYVMHSVMSMSASCHGCHVCHVGHTWPCDGCHAYVNVCHVCQLFCVKCLCTLYVYGCVKALFVE